MKVFVSSCMEISHLTYIILPNIAAKYLAFLLCIREVPGSDVGQGVGYPD
jgi:hypothetical protein